MAARQMTTTGQMTTKRHSGVLVLAALLMLAQTAAGQTVLFDFETEQGWGSFGTITTDSGPTFDGSSGFGRFHIGDFSMDDLDPDNPLLWGIVDVSPLGVDLSAYLGFSVDARLRSVPGFPDYTGEKNLDIGIEVAGVEYFAAPVTMTDDYQTFTTRFSDILPPGVDRSDARIKLRVLSSFGMGIGDLNYDQVVALVPGSGDFDGNGLFECADVDALVAEIVAGTNNSLYDLDFDGFVNGADLSLWLAEAGSVNLASGESYLLGDADLNGAVEVSDFNIWNQNKFTATAAWCSGDFNADGSVDVPDFNAWNGNKFTSADSGSLVPEPATWGLAMAGFLATIFFRRGANDLD